MSRLNAKGLVATLLVLAFSATLGGCSGGVGTGTVPLTGKAPQKGCPLVSSRGASPELCGGGGAPPDGYLVSAKFANGFSYANPASNGNYNASGEGTDLSYNVQSTTTGAVTTDPSDGTANYTINAPSIASGTYGISTIAPAYLGVGTFTLPNGGTLTATASNTAAATEVVNGVTWTVSGVLDADGHDVDLTYQSSSGYEWTSQLDANVIAPTEMGVTTAAMKVRGLRPMASTAAKVAAIAGVVAFAATAVAFYATATGAGAPVGLVAGGIALIATGVGAVATCVDVFSSDKKNGQKT